MQAFKLYFKILNRHKGMVLLYVAIFMALSVLLASLKSKSGEGFQEKRIDIALINEDGTSVGEAIKAYFADSQNVTEMEYDEEKISEGLYWKEIDYVILIPKGFEESLLNGEPMELSSMQVPGAFDAVYFETELNQYLQKLTALLSSGYALEEAQETIKDLAETKVNVETASFVNANQNDLMTSYFLYAPYLFLTSCVIGIGTILIKINEKKLKDRTECGYCTMRSRIVGLVSAIVLFGVMLMAVVIIFAVVMSQGSILLDARFPWFFLNVISVLFLGLGIGFFAGMLAKNQNTINGMVNIISLSFCFLGGIFVPQEYFGAGIKNIARLVPTYWYVVNNERIGQMVSASPDFIRRIIAQASVSIGYALAFFAVTLVIVSAKRKSGAGA